MDADLRAMTVQRRDCLTDKSGNQMVTLLLCKDFGSNRGPLATASSDGSAILSCLANQPHRD
jgi:hypothetical protein